MSRHSTTQPTRYSQLGRLASCDRPEEYLYSGRTQNRDRHRRGVFRPRRNPRRGRAGVRGDSRGCVRAGGRGAVLRTGRYARGGLPLVARGGRDRGAGVLRGGIPGGDCERRRRPVARPAVGGGERCGGRPHESVAPRGSGDRVGGCRRPWAGRVGDQRNTGGTDDETGRDRNPRRVRRGVVLSRGRGRDGEAGPGTGTTCRDGGRDDTGANGPRRRLAPRRRGWRSRGRRDERLGSTR